MKSIGNESILAIFMVLSKVTISVYAAAIESSTDNGHFHLHHKHHDHNHEEVHPPQAATSNEHDHHDDTVVEELSHSSEVEVSIKAHGEDCLEENFKCNEKSGLICLEELGKCECDAGTIFSSILGKCHQIEEIHVDTIDELSDDPKDEYYEVETTTVPPSTTKQPKIELLKQAVEQGDDDDDVSDTIHHEIQGQHDDHQHHHDNVPINKCESKSCEHELGKYSKCDEHSGECICSDTENLNRSLTLVNGKCWIDKKINDPCTIHEECSATIKGNAWCHTDLETKKQFCQCEMFNYFDETLQECLQFADDGLFSPCKTDLQCRGIDPGMTGHGFGPNARCSPEKGVCECKLGPDDQKGFLHQNYCFYQLEIEDPCVIDKECQMSLPGSFCSPETKTCSLRSTPIDADGSVGGRKIDGSSADADGNAEASSSTNDNEGLINSLKSAIGIEMPNFVFIMIIAAVVILVVVALSVFILKKRHKYTMVRTREMGESNT